MPGFWSHPLDIRLSVVLVSTTLASILVSKRSYKARLFQKGGYFYALVSTLMGCTGVNKLRGFKNFV